MKTETYERILSRVRNDARLFGNDIAKADQCSRIIAHCKRRLAPVWEIRSYKERLKREYSLMQTWT